MKKNTKKMVALCTGLLVLSLAACGTKSEKKPGTMAQDNMQQEMTTPEHMDKEAKNMDEAVAMHKELTAQENTIFSQNTALWEKVFLEADKGMAMIEDGKNYGEFLLDTIDSIKEQFKPDELKLIQGEAEKIRDIEMKLTALEEKYPEAAQKSLDSTMDMSENKQMSMSGDTENTKKFPAFSGKDLDGNPVESDEFFSKNAVTVVNFWFTTCGPCVSELNELDSLNKELEKKGGALIGINAFTLDGNKSAIEEAKDVLAKKGATYRNIYFDSGSDAGKFVETVYAYPTTYVVDRNGNLVGDPIVGVITGKAQIKKLNDLIEETLAKDMN